MIVATLMMIWIVSILIINIKSNMEQDRLILILKRREITRETKRRLYGYTYANSNLIVEST